MCKVKDVLKQATEAFVAGDGKKYMSLVSERTREGIEKLGGIDFLMEVSSVTLEDLGEEAVIELTLATVDQFKLVDGGLENVSLEALSETENFDKLMEQSKEGLKDFREFILDEGIRREFRMAKNQFDMILTELGEERVPDGFCTKISEGVYTVTVPEDFRYKGVIYDILRSTRPLWE